jgi:hypothetical protein
MAHAAIRDAQKMASRYGEDLADESESWKTKHDAAMKCRDLEESLAVLNGLLRLCFDLKSRYDAFEAGEQLDCDPFLDETVDQGFVRLLASCVRVDQRISACERQDFQVDGASEFRRHLDEVGNSVKESERIAVIEGRMGFRGVSMSPEAAGNFRLMTFPTKVPSVNLGRIRRTGKIERKLLALLALGDPDRRFIH